METYDDKGVYSGAVQLRAHPSRVGGPIAPRAVVVHTTDMAPGAWSALKRAWTQVAGKTTAHFMIGRDGELVQMVPIIRNANHAGGTPHGWWFDAHTGSRIHPNTLAIGVELHSAGRLRWKTGDARTAQLIEDHKVLGEFGLNEIYVDERDRPWHLVTEAQLEALEGLLWNTRTYLANIGTIRPQPNEAYTAATAYAKPFASSLVGHVSLDTVNRSDPGPQVMAFLNDFAKKDNWK